MVWEPYDPYARRRRELARRAQAEERLRQQEAQRQRNVSMDVVQRLQEALQRSQQEREALVQRYEQQLEAARKERQQLRQEAKQALTRLASQAREQLEEAQQQQQRLQQQIEQLQRELAGQPTPRPAASADVELVQRFQAELADARRERDAWADRYDQALSALDDERERLQAERETLNSARATLEREARADAEQQRERLVRNAEQKAFEENRATLVRLIEVADNLERALQQQESDSSAIAEGVAMTLNSFRRALEHSGVERIRSAGEPFDPTQHEAISTTTEGDAPAGTVVRELLPGYLYRGVLLRPAKVIIAAG
ncbi:MAG: nucleotide exchange factor GrpE [Anaerolineales bacterium]|nr:nucleotide exchange factor GrpE [Anaerolineales bacterium]MCB9129267.1 nucleotide exchange factor GrpE [Ardenticatenales bacterium]MCB9171346.1 nucleotide exchange factor GrpE [Ardenticatenales bacterium]